MEEVVGAKVVVLILLGLIKLGSGLLPLLLDKVLQRKKVKWLEKFMSGMLCVGGGVLLATVFVHMLPEVRESLENSAKKAKKASHSHDDHDHDEHDHGYPLAELVVCAGFFLIYLIEALVTQIFGLDHGHGHSHGAKPKNEVHNVENGGIDNIGFNDTTNDGPIRSPPDTPNTTGVSTDTDVPKTICSPQLSQDNHPDNVDASISPFGFKYKCSSPSKLIGPRNVYNVSSATLTSYTSYSDGDSLDASLPNHLGLPVVKQKKSKTSLGTRAREKKILASIRNFLIVLALSIHSVFEGMAIGLQLNVSDVWKLFAAISIHAVAILFSIGAEMITSGTKRLQIIFYMITLAFVTPLGVIIGMIITEYVDTDSSANQFFIIGLLQGLAGGTLLYITFFEVLDKEKLSKLGLGSLYGCFLLILGFGVMAGLEAAGGHSHGVTKHDHAQGHGHLHGHIHDHINHQHPIIVDEDQLMKIDPRLPQILKDHNHEHDHNHDHDHDGPHEHSEHEHAEHSEHEHDEHNEHDHQHEDEPEPEHSEDHDHDHEHNDHEHDDHEHDDHEHDDHEHDDHEHDDHEHDDHKHDDHEHEHDHQHEDEPEPEHNNEHSEDHHHEHEHNDHEHDDHAHNDHEHHDHEHEHDHQHEDEPEPEHNNEHSEHDDHAHNDHEHDEHQHDDHQHDDHEHDDHGHDDHEQDDHQHDDHQHDDHQHDDHQHDEHEHDEPVENKAYFPIPVKSKT